MRVVEAPGIKFRCDSCGAVNEGSSDEFREQNTMPPSWMASCAFCGSESRCFPACLIARHVGEITGSLPAVEGQYTVEVSPAVGSGGSR